MKFKMHQVIYLLFILEYTVFFIFEQSIVRLFSNSFEIMTLNYMYEKRIVLFTFVMLNFLFVLYFKQIYKINTIHIYLFLSFLVLLFQPIMKNYI